MPAIQRLFINLRPKPQIEIIIDLFSFMPVIGKKHHVKYFNWLIHIGYTEDFLTVIRHAH